MTCSGANMSKKTGKKATTTTTLKRWPVMTWRCLEFKPAMICGVCLPFWDIYTLRKHRVGLLEAQNHMSMTSTVELMEYRTPAHRAISTQKWLQDRKVKRFQRWPGNSPDLKSIDYLWNQVKHAQCLEHATSIPGLKKLRVASGDKSHQNTYRASMNRCRGKWLRSFRQGKATPDIEYLDWLFEPVFYQ